MRAILRPAMAPLFAELIHAIEQLKGRKMEKDDFTVDAYGFVKAKKRKE